MMTTTNIFNKRAAKAAGYRALTSRYYLPQEQAMLDAVVADLRRGRIGHVLVKDHLGVSVWRSFRTPIPTPIGGGALSESARPQAQPTKGSCRQRCYRPCGKGRSRRERRHQQRPHPQCSRLKRGLLTHNS